MPRGFRVLDPGVDGVVDGGGEVVGDGHSSEMLFGTENVPSGLTDVMLREAPGGVPSNDLQSPPWSRLYSATRGRAPDVSSPTGCVGSGGRSFRGDNHCGGVGIGPREERLQFVAIDGPFPEEGVECGADPSARC